MTRNFKESNNKGNYNLLIAYYMPEVVLRKCACVNSN